MIKVGHTIAGDAQVPFHLHDACVTEKLLLFRFLLFEANTPKVAPNVASPIVALDHPLIITCRTKMAGVLLLKGSKIVHLGGYVECI